MDIIAFIVVGGIVLFVVALLGSAGINLKTTIAPKPDRCVHGVIHRPANPCSECVAERQQRMLEYQQKRDEEEREVERLRIQESKNIRDLIYLQEMDPIEFERLVGQAYRNLGWEVEDTPGTGDAGVDAYLRKDGRTVILQCKRLSSSRVGTPVLRDLLGTIVAKKADRGILATTTSFSEQAFKFAQDSEKIELVDGHTLLKIIAEAYPENSPVPEEFITRRKKLKVVPTRCPWCGKKTRRVKGPKGPFYGCTGYFKTGCRWTMSIPRRGYRIVKK